VALASALVLALRRSWPQLEEMRVSAQVKIVERYDDYAPPVDVHRSLRMLLRNTPEQYLSGLHRITLTNSKLVRSSYPGKAWREGRRTRLSDHRGFYQAGFIFLVLDQIFLDWPEVMLLFPPFKTFLIAEVLYHEIRHHIHRIEVPGYRADKETVADEWKEKLFRTYVRRRYWYLAGTIKLLAKVIRPLAQRFKTPVVEETKTN